MSGILTHSPAEIVANQLVALSIGTLRAAAGTWPIGFAYEPDSPDNAVTVYDTTEDQSGQLHSDGSRFVFYGVQIRVRADRYTTGFAKANAIEQAFCKDFLGVSITIDSTTYLINTTNIASGPLYNGREPGTEREIFTINGFVSLDQQ